MATAPTPGRTRPPLKVRPAVIEWDGKSYTYEPSKITVQTAIAIKMHTGLNLKAWAKACDDWDPAAVQALLYAVKAQASEPTTIAELEFSIVDFMEAFTAAMVKVATDAIAEAGLEDDPDPSGAEEDIPDGTTTSATSGTDTSSS